MRKNGFFIFVILLLNLWACNQDNEKIKIGYVQIVDDVVLNVAKDELFKTLADSGFVNGENIKIIENIAQGDLSMLPTIFQSLIAQNVDMIITCGTPCMIGATQAVRDIPLVFTVAFGPEQVGMKSIPHNLYGAYDPLNTSGFVSMMQEFLPDLKRVGMPYNNSEANAEYSAKRFSKEFSERNIQLVTGSVTNINDLVMVCQSLVSQDIDAILVSADNLIFNGLNVVIKIAEENKIPLFVSDIVQVDKGAAAGQGVSYKLWGRKSALKAISILKGRDVIQNIEPFTEEEFTINLKACEKQGLIVPESLIEKADRLIE